MKNLKRILDLIKKTGDRYIFEDEQGEVFVVTGISDYETLVLKNSSVKNLSEEELLNRINKDIAIWKSSLETEKTDFIIEPDEEKEKEDHYYFEPIEDEE